jgi:hypothetical protein
MKIKILVNFNGNVEGESLPFKVGEEVDIPEQDAIQFVRARYAQLIVDAPAVKIMGKPKETGRKAHVK